ncbi:hypothetical protein [Nocardia salmonicida]|uniref:hypothetical protein n=1 Tax=Nocardia salmonicida TaxID=53431 RepID=UPI0033CBA532
MAALPIGIFDSGFGGLTVARSVIDQLPHESVIYLGDTAPRQRANKHRRAPSLSAIRADCPGLHWPGVTTVAVVNDARLLPSDTRYAV